MEGHKGLFNLEIQAVSSVHTQVSEGWMPPDQHSNTVNVFLAHPVYLYTSVHTCIPQVSMLLFHSPWSMSRLCRSTFVSFSISSPLLLLLSLLPVLTNPTFSLPGQPPGAFLHPLPCTGRWSNIPCADQGGEDSREQAGAWAEAQHHSPVLVQSRGSGPLPPPSAR